MKTLGKRGRGLDPAVMVWLMTTLQVGPGIGDVHLLVKEGTAFESWARDDLRVEPSHLHFDFAAAEDALTAGRNDTLLVYPGAHAVTVEVAWDKDNTHIVGLGGPVQWTDYSEPGVAIYTATNTVVDTIDITGDFCQFHNVNISNAGAANTCVSAVNNDGYGNYFKNVVFQGNMTSQQAGNANCASLIIDGKGYSCLFENCTIGDNQWATISAGCQLLFATSAQGPPNGVFRRCLFLAHIETTASVYMVILRLTAGGDSLGRHWLFDECHFTNFWTNWADQLDECFNSGCSSTHNLMLRNCSSQGIDKWGGNGPNGRFGTNHPIVGVGGGQARTPNATTGT